MRHLVIGLALAAALLFSGSAHAAGYSFSGVPPGAIHVGDQFELEVDLDLMGSDSLGHSIGVLFDSSILAIVSTLESGVPPFALHITPGAEINPSSVGFEAVSFTAVPDPGSPFEVGIVTFEAIALGTTAVGTVSGQGQGVLDGDGFLISGVQQALAQVVVPEPDSLVLMVAGLVGLIILGRRRLA